VKNYAKNNHNFVRLSLALLIFIICWLGVERLLRLGMIKLGYQYNYRIIWGLVDLPYQVGLAGGILFLTLELYFRKLRGVKITLMPAIVAYSFITAGVILNTIDRIQYQAVFDYITINWLYCNLADVYIVLGLVLLMV